MAVREILLYPRDKTDLRAMSNPVGAFNRHIKGVIEDLKDLPQNIIIADRAVIKTGILKAWNPELGWIQS